jgi:hypothetical protein
MTKSPEVRTEAAQEALLTVSELAKKHGQWTAVNAGIDGVTPFSAKHLVAAVRHGWNHFALQHGDEEVRLSDSDYLAALEAAHHGKVCHGANRRAHEAPIEPEVEAKKTNKSKHAKKDGPQ